VVVVTHAQIRNQHWAAESLGRGLVGVGLAVSLLVAPASSLADGLESVDLLTSLQSIVPSEGFKAGARAETSKLGAVEDNFQKSDTLKRLLEQSEANKAKNKKEILDKYCYRQAEMGVGDCGGLQYIPGMTDSGKQRTPDWLSDLLGLERAPESQGTGELAKLFGGELPE